MSDRILAILAGGFSRRFQSKEGQWSDKALMVYRNKPLLIHLLEESNRYYEHISISINTETRKKIYSSIINKHIPNVYVKYVVDLKKTCFKGVLQGICSTMNSFTNKIIQFIPSDRPYLCFKILNELKVKNNGVSILKYSNGMIEPLLALYGSDSRIPKQFLKLPLARADVPIRLAQIIHIYSIDDLIEMNDIPYNIFANINVHDDLNQTEFKLNNISDLILPSPERIERQYSPSLVDKNKAEDVLDVHSSLIEKEHYYTAYLWALLSLKQKKIDLEMFENIGKETLLKEISFWKENNIPFLELHALLDLVNKFPDEQTKTNMTNVLRLKEKMKIKPRRLK